MRKVRIILMSKGRVEYDYYSKMPEVNLKEIITIQEENNFMQYNIEFIQYFFDDKGKFLYTMITGIKQG